MSILSLNKPTDLDCQSLKPFGLLIQPVYLNNLWQIPSEQLRQLTWEHRLLILRGFPTFERDSFIQFCNNWGELLHWDFGVIFDLVVHENPTNYLLTNSKVPFHWDGAFIETVPSFEFFQCLQAPEPSTGGETLFCDTTRIWQKATPEQQQVWRNIEITYTTESNAAHYGGQITVPLVNQHPQTGVTVLRFGEPLELETAHLTRLNMKISGLPSSEQESFLKEMQSLIYSPENCFIHQWQDGDLVIGDNHALLHARNKFLKTTPRHLQRIHVL